jgi:predicted Zn-dependent protease
MFSTRRQKARRSVHHSGGRPATKVRPELESLESRVVLFATNGGLWAHPQLITLSFMPDGTNTWGGASSLQSTFNAERQIGNGVWQSIILKAAQYWAQQTNINFELVPDDGADEGGGSYEQGSPEFGDIRFGGFNFGSSYPALATTILPPNSTDTSSDTGDIMFNTAYGFGINSNMTYDLFTVAVHEIGHAIGMDHSTTSLSNVMYPNYTVTKSVLSSDDIAGVRSLYSNGQPRSLDSWAAAGLGNTMATSLNVNGVFNAATDTSQLTGLDNTTTTQAEYYTYNVPAGTTSYTVAVQSAGLSLFTPKVTVYAPNRTTVLGTSSGAGQYGTTLTVHVSGVTAGDQDYVVVQGADATAFSTGAYALTLNFGTNPSPAVPLPQTQVLTQETYTGYQPYDLDPLMPAPGVARRKDALEQAFAAREKRAAARENVVQTHIHAHSVPRGPLASELAGLRARRLTGHSAA